LEKLRIVAYHAHVQHLAVKARQHAVDRVAIAVEDLPGRRLAPDGHELVARGEKRHPQPAVDGDLAYAERRDEADVGRAQRQTTLQRDLADGEILAGLAQVLALLVAFADRDPATRRRGLLLHHDRVRAFRDHAPRHDAHGLARAHRALVWRAGKR